MLAANVRNLLNYIKMCTNLNDPFPFDYFKVTEVSVSQ